MRDVLLIFTVLVFAVIGFIAFRLIKKKIEKVEWIFDEEGEKKEKICIEYEGKDLRDCLVKTVHTMSKQYPEISFSIVEKSRRDILRDLSNEKIQLALVHDVISFPKDCEHTTLHRMNTVQDLPSLQISWNGLCTPKFRNDFITNLCDNYGA